MDQSSDICSQWKSLDFAFKSVDFEKNLEKVIEELQNQPARNDVVFIDKVMNLQKTVRLVYSCFYF
jgi:triacylglycerol esterase/lipase EstA (alpha/beta hydrolase family)